MGTYASRKERKRFSEFWRYLLITVIAVMLLLFIVNFLLPMIGDAEDNGGDDSDNIIIDIDVNDEDLNADNE